MASPKELSNKLDILSSVLDEKIEHTKGKLSSKSKLIMDICDIGFKKISDKKYTMDIRNRNKSYITFALTFRGRSVDIHEDHLVIHEKHEIPSSQLGEDYNLTSVRYSKVLGEISSRAEEILQKFKEEINEI